MPDAGRHARASRLIGANPRGSVSVVSQAVRAAVPTGVPEVAVGLSGGADSLALAVCAIDWCSRQGIRVRTLTVDHGGRDGSEAEADRVAGLARELGADDALVLCVDMTTGDGGPETRAREVRRRALAEAAGDAPVLLGHTLDDQAETVLMRLGRGSGAGSLRAMAPAATDPDGQRWIRPLLGVRRADTTACCAALGLDPVADPTNAADGPWQRADGGALARQAIRDRVLPALADALGQDPAPALARTAALLAADDDALDLWARRVEGDDAPSSSIDVAELEGQPEAVRTRVLHRRLAAIGRPGDVDADAVARVDALITDWHGQGPLDLPGVRVRRAGGRLEFL